MSTKTEPRGGTRGDGGAMTEVVQCGFCGLVVIDIKEHERYCREDADRIGKAFFATVEEVAARPHLFDPDQSRPERCWICLKPESDEIHAAVRAARQEEE